MPILNHKKIGTKTSKFIKKLTDNENAQFKHLHALIFNTKTMAAYYLKHHNSIS